MQQCVVQQETMSIHDTISLRKLQSLGKCHNENMSKAACLAIILAYATEEETVYRKRKRSIWTKEWLKRRSVFGHGNLIKELELSSPLDYKNYLRMCPSTFGELLELITPLVQREDTNMREAISPKQRLFATLRFLASGLTFENLKFETAIAAQTLGRIIIETCEAVTRVLKNYIQVRRNDKRLY